MSAVTDEQVETGARALYGQMGLVGPNGIPVRMTPWDELTDREQANWLRWARAVLESQDGGA